MIRYNYIPLNEEIFIIENGEKKILGTELKINKSVKEVFPDRETVLQGIKDGRDTSLIKAELLRATIGSAEGKFVKIEEDWYKIATKLLNLEKELRELNSTNVESLEATEIAKIEERIKELDGYSYVTYDGPRSSKVTNVVEGLISKTRTEMLDMEAKNEWLKAYRGEDTDVIRPEPASNIVMNVEDVKKLIAHERDLKVRNSEDSIADVAKMVSLAFSVIATLWELTPDDAKDNISAEKKGLIDYAVFKFNQINTRADRQIAAEGTALVDKLYDREVAIADIVDKVKEETN